MFGYFVSLTTVSCISFKADHFNFSATILVFTIVLLFLFPHVNKPLNNNNKRKFFRSRENPSGSRGFRIIGFRIKESSMYIYILLLYKKNRFVLFIYSIHCTRLFAYVHHKAMFLNK